MDHEAVKRCTKCGESFRLDHMTVDRRSIDGRGTRCKPCHASIRRALRREDPESVRRVDRAHAMSRRPERAARARAYARFNRVPMYVRRYGLTEADYADLLARQGGICAVCREPGRRLSVDHDHSCCPNRSMSCGACVRGLLCTRCNTLLGHLEASPDLVERLYAYARGARIGIR